MGSQDGSSQMLPLIDFGDDNDSLFAPRLGEASSQVSSSQEHHVGDFATEPWIICNDHTSIISFSAPPSRRSSNPFVGSQWGPSELSSLCQRSSFDGHRTDAWTDGIGRENLDRISSSQPGSSEALQIQTTPQSLDLLSDFSISFSPSLVTGNAILPGTSQADLLSSQDIFALDNRRPYARKDSALEWDDWRSSPTRTLFDSSFQSTCVSAQMGSDSFPSLSASAKDSPDFWSWTPFQAMNIHEDSSQSHEIRRDFALHQRSVSGDESSSGEKVSIIDKQRCPDITKHSTVYNGHPIKVPTECDHYLTNLWCSEERNCGMEPISPDLSSSPSTKESRSAESSPSANRPEGNISPEYSKFASLGDFVGTGGGKGTFKPPSRGAVHLERPLSFELRPRPLKRMQTSQTIGVLACTENAVYASCELGIMVWDSKNAYGANCDGRDNSVGDEDAAGFTLLSVHGSTITSLVLDVANDIIWSGHSDGKLRAWPMNASCGNERTQVAAILTWQGHQTPVLAMVVTSYGELWTGSENGSIRAWPCEITVEVLSNGVDESHTVASYLASSYIDIRSRGMSAGASSLPNTDVRFLVADHSAGRVWSGGSYLLALWDARTRDILKVFGPNAQAEFSSPDISPVRENIREDEAKLNMTKVLKKEKAQRPLSFFQRSRNAVIGAADAVLRAAIGGQSCDGSKKIEALGKAPDGTIWAGYANGMLVQWDSNGNRLNEEQHSLIAIRCICSVGTRLWVGYADGRVQVLDMRTGKLLGGWYAHKAAIAQMDVGGDHVFTFASHGGIRGWNLASPSALDQILRSEICAREPSFTRFKKLKILAGTWNVSQERASYESLKLWLANGAAKANIVVIGLQEMEMGAGALAMAAAKETVGLEGSAYGQWWLENIGNAIGGQRIFERVASRQLAGLLIGAWVRKNIVPHVGEVYVGAVACGFGRALGNKGAVAVKMIVFRRTVCVVNCHFAAHIDAVARRNADFEHVYHRMAFGRSLTGVGVAASAMAAGVSSAVQMIRGANVQRSVSASDVQDGYVEKNSPPKITGAEVNGEVIMPELSEADMLIWVGDFNYRIDGVTYEDAIDLVSHASWEVLLAKDQLRIEMKAGRVFQGMREGPISFPPTYKFDKCVNGIGPYPPGYDSSEKKRVPAWCDRILYRDSLMRTDSERQISLAHPVLASIAWYEACMDVLDSDHKPVCSMFHVELAVIDEAARREAYGFLMKTSKEVQQCLHENSVIPETVLNTDNLCLVDYNKDVLRVTNQHRHDAVVFNIYSEGEPSGSTCPCKQNHNMLSKRTRLRGCGGFPRWLQVIPAAGVIGPKQTVEISFRYGEVLENDMNGTQQSWHTDTEKDKVVVIVVNIKGLLSNLSRHHQVCISHRSLTKLGPQYGDLVECRQRMVITKISSD